MMRRRGSSSYRAALASISHAPRVRVHAQLRGTVVSATFFLFQRIRASCYSGTPLPRPGPPAGPLALYRDMVRQGKLRHDTFQEEVASELEGLLHRLEQYEKEMEEYHVNLANWEKKRESERVQLLVEEAQLKQNKGVWAKESNSRSRFFDKWILRRRQGNPEGNREPGVGKMVSYLNRERKLDSLVGRRPVAPAAPKGIYLYGNVGSGKTMLMDMFYCATEGIVKHRRRFHFHEAMLEINQHMHNVWKNQVEEKSSQSRILSWITNLPFDTKVKEWLVGEERYKQEVQAKHILPAVADKFLVDQQTKHSGASILCFDEIQTVDVFAIVALSGILSRLLSSGTVLVATSNRAPEDLNQVHYFWPSSSDIRKKFEETWNKVIDQSGGRCTSASIPVMFGRALEVPESCNGIARFNFEYLCGRPVGAADYIAIARNYHTIFISDIPVMSMRIRDKARRFITLIDEVYNHHCCLFCLAASSIDNLFQGTEEGTLFDLESFQFETETESGGLRRDVLAAGSIGSGPAPAEIASLLSGQEEMFAFRRAISRLVEMQTPLYMERVCLFHPLHREHAQQLQSHLTEPSS